MQNPLKRKGGKTTHLVVAGHMLSPLACIVGHIQSVTTTAASGVVVWCKVAKMDPPPLLYVVRW